MLADRIVSIHAPHAEGDSKYQESSGRSRVSIHAPHAEGDDCFMRDECAVTMFQSTPPMRRATLGHLAVAVLQLFQSTPPMRRATLEAAKLRLTLVFQSTPPMRRATRRRGARP